MEKELHASDSKLRWFEYKLGKNERQLGKANLWVASLEEEVLNLEVLAELYKEAIVRAEDNASNRGIDVGFKIFRRLLLKANPSFDM